MPLSKNLRVMDNGYEGQLLVDSSNTGREIGSNIVETTNVGTTLIRYGTFVVKESTAVGRIRNLISTDTAANIVGVVPELRVNQRIPVLLPNGRIEYQSGILPNLPVSVMTTGIIWLLSESAMTKGATGLLVRSVLNTAGTNNFARIGRVSSVSDGLAGSAYLTTTTGQITALDTLSAGQIGRFAVNFSRVNLLT